MLLDYSQSFVLINSILYHNLTDLFMKLGELHFCTRCLALLKIRIFILKRYFNTFAQIQGLASPTLSGFISLLFFFTEDSFMSKYKNNKIS